MDAKFERGIMSALDIVITDALDADENKINSLAFLGRHEAIRNISRFVSDLYSGSINSNAFSNYLIARAVSLGVLGYEFIPSGDLKAEKVEDAIAMGELIIGAILSIEINDEIVNAEKAMVYAILDSFPDDVLKAIRKNLVEMSNQALNLFQ